MDALRQAVGERRMEELNEDASEFMKQMGTLGLNEVRPWNEFFSGFKPPSQWKLEVLEQRVVTNFLHWRTNYLLTFIATLLIAFLTSPLLLLMLLLSTLLSVYLIAVHKGPIVLGSVKVEADKKALLCGAVSLVLLLLSGQLLQLLGALFLGLLLPIAHMVFRKRSVHSKFNKFSDEVKLNGGLFGRASQASEAADPEDGLGKSSSVQDRTVSTGTMRQRVRKAD